MSVSQKTLSNYCQENATHAWLISTEMVDHFLLSIGSKFSNQGKVKAMQVYTIMSKHRTYYEKKKLKGKNPNWLLRLQANNAPPAIEPPNRASPIMLCRYPYNLPRTSDSTEFPSTTPSLELQQDASPLLKVTTSTRRIQVIIFPDLFA